MDDFGVMFGKFLGFKILVKLLIILRIEKCEYADAAKRSIMNMYSKRGAMNMLYPQAKPRFLIFLDIFHTAVRPLRVRLARNTGKNESNLSAH